MGVSVVARFTQLSEAHVAAGALRSAGFHAEVMDENFAVTYWLEQQVLGGIRVIVPQTELADAVQYLKDILKDRPERAPEPHPGAGWRGLAIVVGVIIPPLGLLLYGPLTWWKVALLMIGAVGTPLAWSVVAAAKSRGREGQLGPMLMSALLVAVFGLLLAGVVAALIQWAHPSMRSYG